MSFDFNELPYAYGQPTCQAALKTTPEDFEVEEILGYPLSGEGEHLWLWIEKRGENTDFIAQALAKWLGLSGKAIGYAGKKDRQALTRQWFSVHLPGTATPDLSTCPIANIQILDNIRHSKKLQTGGLQGNRFKLVLRHFQGNLADLTQRCERVQQQGVPNYFGEQRFGKNMNNLTQATALLTQDHQNRKQRNGRQRNQQGMYISAARSWIFNQILAKRLSQGSLLHLLSGDVLMLEGSQACFMNDDSEQLQQRLHNLDIHLTGALVGRGRLMTQLDALVLEHSVIEQYPEWQNGLEHVGLNQERRALRVVPKDFEWQFDQDNLQLRFTLPAGSYATMVLRELILVND